MWYREGTITFTQGSNTLVGAGTAWNVTANGVLPGMIVIGPDNKLYEIKRVISDTNIVLSEPYTGETQSEVPCRIITTYEGDLTQFSARFTALMSRMSADSKSMRSWLTALDEVTIEREDGTEVTVKPLMQIVNEHNENVEWYKNNTDAIDAAGDKAREAAASAAAAAESANTAGEKASQASQSASAAESSKSAAATSAGAAKTSETNAAASQKSAATSASTATTKASEAATSARDAAASKEAAKSSQTSAASSASNAASSATAAGNSAKAAKTSETNARSSETAAGQSASAAAGSKTAAASSASAASTSAGQASASATAAGKSAESAASSASTATTKAGQATEQASAAARSASAAKTSETNAKASETRAESSKTAAASSASSAASSASSASASKDEATRQASAAKGSATTASTKATEAAGSATAASQSKTAAESAATRAEAAADRAEEIAGAVAMEDASLTTKGVVKLSSAVDSTSESLAATPKAVKTVKDSSVQKTGDTMGGQLKISTINALRIFNQAFGLIFRRSEDHLHLIPTNEGEGENGDIGSLRPFSINLRSGLVSIGNGLKVGGSVTGNLTGNADTATKIKTARKIGGVAFDGSADINLPGVNATGNQNTTGNAATATKLQAARTINGVSFDGSANITLTPSNIGALALTGGTLSGGLTAAGEIISKSANGLRIAYGNYGFFIRNDGSNTYFMLTDSGNSLGTYNSLRPFIISNSTGNVTIATKLNASSGITGSLSGNASTATKLQTARSIGGVGFDGSANINLPGVNTTGNQNTTGNAATATKLQTARTIGGVAFDGSANINLPGVNTAGNQNTTGNAATATKLQTARNINGVKFDGSGDININTLVSRGRVTALSGSTQGTAGIQMYEAYNNSYPTTYGNVLHMKGASAAGEGELLIGWSGTDGAHAPVYVRSRRDTSTANWSDWAQVYTSRDSIPGVNATGNQNTTGNAATATKLQTARTINGVSFDGSKNIELTPRSIGTINSATMSFSGGAGWFKLATVTMPQNSSIVYIALIGGAGYNVGAPHQAGISELVLRAGNGMPKGITGALWRRTSVGFTNFAWVNTSGDTYDIYVEIGNYATGVNIQWDYTSNASVTIHTSPTYTANKPTGLTDGTVYVIYSSHIKPTAAEVGALSLSGGQLNGALGIGTSSALGGNSIVLGDNDTGFKQNGDGILDVYANSAHVFRFVNSTLQSLKPLSVTGDITSSAWVYANRFSINSGSGAWIDMRNQNVIFGRNAVSTSSAQALLRQDHADRKFFLGGLGNSQFGFYMINNSRTENGTDANAYLHNDGTWVCGGNGSFNDVYIRSDRRSKRNIRKIERALDKLDRIEGVLYEIQVCDRYEQSGGLIAQDVQNVQPELVTVDHNDQSGEPRLRLNYNGVIGMLVEAVKELREEVRELKAKM
ncbi:TPA: tail fiber domain-containing protein [Escherichia coli]